MGFVVAAGLSTVACGSDPVAQALPSEPAPAPAPKPAPTQPDLGDTATDPATTVPACDSTSGTYTATREPSNVLFLFDRSGSMHIKLPSGQTRWQAMEDGFFELLGELPATTGAGLMLFPQGDAPVNAYCGIDASINDVTCKDTWPEPGQTVRCDPTTYKQNVPSALLSSTQVTSMKNQVSASDSEFYWGTPLASAITGAIATQRASTLPGVKSVILLTDGNPTSCDQTGISDSISNVTAAAAEGLNGELVRTYVIGLTDSSRQAAKAENLSPIAVAGGTKRTATCEQDNSCFYALSDATFAADLKKIFEEISLQAFDCTFNMPPASSAADPSLIQVKLTNSGGSHTVSQDTTHANGWDYLPNGKQVQLYGQACTDMKDATAKLNIVVGCKTLPPKQDPDKPTK
jgi:hypothetical protein